MPGTSKDAAPVLDDAEAGRRRQLLATLQAALAELGIQSTLARKHRLVLRFTDGLAGPNGLTDPQLFVFTESGTAKITTNGTAYQLNGGQELPAANPAAAAAIISRSHKIRSAHLNHP
jgi:hypothetical protein